MENFLENVMAATTEFLSRMPKTLRKKKGQFFTSPETAAFMAGLFSLQDLPSEIKVLDPGAGTGILAAALVQRLATERQVQKICLVCYENDPEVLPVLEANLQYLAKALGRRFSFEIREENYILSQKDAFNGKPCTDEVTGESCDLVIENPPYLKISRDSAEALAMPEVVHGAPNLYFLFAAMSLFNLKDQGQMVCIIPRSWTSGAYFTAFRAYFLKHGKPLRIHLFVSRDKVFSKEQVLQETMIIKMVKTASQPDRVLISSSQSNGDFSNISALEVPWSSVTGGPQHYVFLPTSRQEVEVLSAINTYSNNLPDDGLRMRTGIVVDFRQRRELRKSAGAHTLPLFYSRHIKNGRVNHNPGGKNDEWISDAKQGLLQKNHNYVFCKRFTAKEERRRLQCGIFLSKEFPNYAYIATQNKINYVDRTDGQEMPADTAYGVYALLNSTLYDRYYRILNGSTQVNSTEVNSIPVPPLQIIDRIGQSLMATKDLSTENCDKIVMRIAYENI